MARPEQPAITSAERKQVERNAKRKLGNELALVASLGWCAGCIATYKIVGSSPESLDGINIAPTAAYVIGGLITGAILAAIYFFAVRTKLAKAREQSAAWLYEAQRFAQEETERKIAAMKGQEANGRP